MTRLRVTILALAFLTAPAWATDQTIPASDFDLADHAGQVVILDFWAGWCKPCLKALPWLSALQGRHGSDGLKVIAVNVDLPDAVPDDIIASLHDDILVVLDPERDFSRPYRLRGLPTTILIDHTGKIRARRTGLDSASHADWEALITKLLAERAAAPSSAVSAPPDDSGESQ